MNFVLSILLSLAVGANFNFDKTVHNFGEIGVKDGPVSCEFTLTNTGSEPLTIFAVVSGCGCTGVSWTREDIAPGAKGVIKATYSNDEGPYAFDKSLTVYTSAQKKPVILHLKGVAVKNKNGSK